MRLLFPNFPFLLSVVPGSKGEMGDPVPGERGEMGDPVPGGEGKDGEKATPHLPTASVPGNGEQPPTLILGSMLK